MDKEEFSEHLQETIQGGASQSDIMHDIDRFTNNLCDTCKHHFAECKSNPHFGIGKGNDNVYKCDVYNHLIKRPMNKEEKFKDWISTLAFDLVSEVLIQKGASWQMVEDIIRNKINQHLQPRSESDAVEFAEWISATYYRLDHNKYIFKYAVVKGLPKDQPSFTIAELYEKFKDRVHENNN